MARSVIDNAEPSAGQGDDPPLVNTHVHVPPNFSAFATVATATERARAEGLVAVGTSNYSDFHVYRPFAAAAASAGIAPLFGLEIIAVLDELRAGGVLVNDPANPGRTYLCGKAVWAFGAPNATATSLLAKTRNATDARIAVLVDRLSGCFADAGLRELPTKDSITDEVAARDGVDPEWVALQERHLARAFQEAVAREVTPSAQAAFLERLLGTGVDRNADPIAIQEAIRSRLMKAGRPAFVPEADVSFDDAYQLILELGGIPCYPTLADGASPICPFEDPPERLAAALLERGIYLAELIPNRNQRDTVDRYVAAFRRAGILVLAGTEHNTQRMMPLAPACKGGVSLSPTARAAFWEATCVVAAHQELGRRGENGYVNPDGRLAGRFADGEARIRWFRELGEDVIRAASQAGLVA